MWGFFPVSIHLLLSGGQLCQAFQCIRELTGEEDEGGGLLVGLGSALLPFFESAFVHAELTRKDPSRDIELGAGLSYEGGIDLRQSKGLGLKRPECDLPLPVRLHGGYPFHHFTEDISLFCRRSCVFLFCSHVVTFSFLFERSESGSFFQRPAQLFLL